MEKRILLSSPTMHGEEMEYVKEAFDKNWIAPLGFNCDNFETEMSDYLSKNLEQRYHSLSLCSGTSALHLALKLAGVKSSDVVLCSDMTFVATVNPVSYEGAKHVFIDSERDTWNMDPASLELAFEKYPNAKAVIMVHLYGTPAKMDELIAICKKHNAVMIEDAAEALSGISGAIEAATAATTAAQQATQQATSAVSIANGAAATAQGAAGDATQALSVANNAKVTAENAQAAAAETPSTRLIW